MREVEGEAATRVEVGIARLLVVLILRVFNTAWPVEAIELSAARLVVPIRNEIKKLEVM